VFLDVKNALQHDSNLPKRRRRTNRHFGPARCALQAHARSECSGERTRRSTSRRSHRTPSTFAGEGVKANSTPSVNSVERGQSPTRPATRAALRRRQTAVARAYRSSQSRMNGTTIPSTKRGWNRSATEEVAFAAAAVSETAAQSLRLEVRVNGRCWVSAVADGERSRWSPTEVPTNTSLGRSGAPDAHATRACGHARGHSGCGVGRVHVPVANGHEWANQLSLVRRGQG
jgi:hypothetical protein